MDILTIIGHSADIIGVLGAIFAALAWINTRKIRNEARKETDRQNQKINVILRNYDTGKTITLPVKTSRAEFSRAELLGRIGMIPMKEQKERKERFAITYLNSKEFYQHLDRVRTGSEEHDFVIPCTENEINQFDVKF